MPDYLQGFFGTAAAGVEARNDITVLVRNVYANRNPLITRLAATKQSVERVDFKTYGHKYRPRSTTLTVAISATTTTGLTVGDASFFMNHDILELVDSAGNGSERVQVAVDPLSGTTLSVTRGVSSTTALTTVTAASTVRLIGNSRTGSEIDQTGLSTLGTSHTQYCQTFQTPVQVGGSAQTTKAQVFPGGITSPFDFNKTMALQNIMDDSEVTCFYGIGQAPVDNTVTAKMDGIRAMLSTNKITANPTNAAAYTATDLIRDTLQAARMGGGDPDVLYVSSEFMVGLATWGHAIQRIDAGETIFGTPIKTILAPFLGDVMIIESILLNPYTAVALTSSEVYIREKRPIFWNQRGNRGDMTEGEWIREFAIELQQESHHAWVEGITGFAAN
jgi:hypothetical protein